MLLSNFRPLPETLAGTMHLTDGRHHIQAFRLKPKRLDNEA